MHHQSHSLRTTTEKRNKPVNWHKQGVAVPVITPVGAAEDDEAQKEEEADTGHVGFHVRMGDQQGP